EAALRHPRRRPYRRRRRRLENHRVSGGGNPRPAQRDRAAFGWPFSFPGTMLPQPSERPAMIRLLPFCLLLLAACVPREPGLTSAEEYEIRQYVRDADLSDLTPAQIGQLSN